MDAGVRLVSWNVNGLRAAVGKGFADSFVKLDADFFLLQETKLQAGQIDLEFPGYKSYWNYADRAGYSGTAIYTRCEPLNVTYGIGVDEFDHEGRVITIEMPSYFVVCVYVPNSQDGLRRLDYRQRWDAAFASYLESLAAVKPVAVGGDFNVAHKEIDLKNPATNHFNAGFTDEERAGMDVILAAGFTDSWRALHPEEIKYSWWSYRMAARQRNVGWRIDYFLTFGLNPVSTEIHNEIFGSDHCPVEVVFNP